MNGYSKTSVSFESQGLKCAGYLYVPVNASAQFSCVVLANGFSGTMDWLLPSYAEKFAEAGFAALIFDYRYFGESEGNPRQLVDIHRQREDIRAAVRFMRNHPRIDPERIALWGTSLGGGHVLQIAAKDPAIAAVIAQVPGIDMVSKKARATINVPPSVIARLLLSSLWDAIRGWFGLSPYYVKVFGEPGETAVFTDPALKPHFDRLRTHSAHWRNEFTPRFYLDLPRYETGTAEKLTMPLLICVAKREVYANPAFQVWVGEQAPFGEVRQYEGDHFDFYHRLFGQVIKDQIDFLRRHLS